MVKSRIIGVLGLIFSVALYILSDSYLAILLLVLMIILGVFLCAYIIYIKNKVEIIFVSSGSMSKKERGFLTVQVKNKSIIPIAKIKLYFRMHNHVTGEKNNEVFDVAVNGRTTESIPFHLESIYCGKISIKLENMQFYDFLGFFSTLVNSQEETHIYVLPDTFPIAMNLINHLIDHEDQDVDSLSKTRANHGELTGIKEYVIGDNLKQVHWKLTSKFDEMIVKELTESIDQSLLILLETSIVDGEVKDKSDVADAIMEAYISISRSLIDNEQIHRIGWFDHEMNQTRIEHISSHDQITQLLPSLLTLTKQTDSYSTIDHYVQSIEYYPFAQIIYVTSGQAAGFIKKWDLPSDITIIRCDESVDHEYISDAKEIVFTPVTMRSRLREFR